MATNARGLGGARRDALCRREGHAQDATPELPTEPILRIETGKHGAIIRRIDTDAENRFAVTASDDKTVRVWSLPDGRLLRVLRLPIDQGDIGKAYAVAISPDGTTVAVGGYTGSAGTHNIFLFDRASGELKQRLRDLPNVVVHLAYSPDGRRLAASLYGNNGIRVFDAGNDYRPLPSDTQYGDDSYWAAFDRSGRLVTTSYDGFVRLYAADRYDTPIARFGTPGHRPLFGRLFARRHPRRSRLLRHQRCCGPLGHRPERTIQAKDDGRSQRRVPRGWLVGGWPLLIRGRVLGRSAVSGRCVAGAAAGAALSSTSPAAPNSMHADPAD